MVLGECVLLLQQEYLVFVREIGRGCSLLIAREATIVQIVAACYGQAQRWHYLAYRHRPYA